MYIQKSMNQMGIMNPKNPFNEAREQDERNRNADIKRFNERSGISTTPPAPFTQRDIDFISKNNAERQRIKEGEEGFARTAEFGNEITQRRNAKEKQKKAEEDAKMEAFIARKRGQRKEDLENAETQSRISKNYRNE